MKSIEINDEIKEIDINDIRLDSKLMYWVTANPEELRDINRLFNFHSITVRECIEGKKNTKLEFYDNYDFMVLNIPEYKENVIGSSELDVFVGNNYIVTVTRDGAAVLRGLEHELINYKQNVIFNSDRSIVKILYYILDKIIFNDYEIISSLENTADNIEMKILKNPDKKYLGELIYLRRQVHRVRNYINPLRYVGDNLLCNENNIIDSNYYRYFEQIGFRFEKLIYSMDSLVQYLVLVREAFEAEIANKTNELMKIFTIIAAIFLPLTLITDIFGMNFEHMDILKFEWGFGATLIFMAITAIILFIMFKRKKWL